MAGLSLARRLTDSGVGVTVFDKGRGPGGRMSTRRDGDLAFDHGVAFFTARDGRFHEQVHEWVGSGVAAPWCGRMVTFRDRRPVALPDEDRYVGTPSMSAPCRRLAAGLTVIQRVRVDGARRAGTSWRLQGEYGADLGAFDALVVTAPPRQTARLLAQSPALVRRMRRVMMAPCWVVMAAFDATFDVDWDAALMETSSVHLAVRDGAKPGRTGSETWVLYASAGWTSAHLESDPKEVSEQLISAFFQDTGVGPARPAFIAAHRWRYSNPAESLADGYLWDARSRAGVCADWCHAGGGVEGAYLSAHGLADEITGGGR